MVEDMSYEHLKSMRDSLSGPGMEVHTVAGVLRTILDHEVGKRVVKEEARIKEEKRVKEEAEKKAVLQADKANKAKEEADKANKAKEEAGVVAKEPAITRWPTGVIGAMQQKEDNHGTEATEARPT
jgi:hypothetical protein